MYNILHELGEADADTVAFTRNAPQFHCCHLVELPIGEYDFSLVRHFFFDFAEAVRFDMLANSSLQGLAKVANKYRGEVKYHTIHANSWRRKLANGDDESKRRIQESINSTWNLALGIFEEGPFEEVLKEAGIFEGEAELRENWLKTVLPLIEKYGLTVPDKSTWQPVYGGRKGEHTQYLQPLLSEMTEVYSIDPTAEW